MAGGRTVSSTDQRLSEGSCSQLTLAAGRVAYNGIKLILSTRTKEGKMLRGMKYVPWCVHVNRASIGIMVFEGTSTNRAILRRKPEINMFWSAFL